MATGPLTEVEFHALGALFRAANQIAFQMEVSTTKTPHVDTVDRIAADIATGQYDSSQPLPVGHFPDRYEVRGATVTRAMVLLGQRGITVKIGSNWFINDDGSQ